MEPQLQSIPRVWTNHRINVTSNYHNFKREQRASHTFLTSHGEVSPHFLHISFTKMTKISTECKPCLTTQNKWEIMFILMLYKDMLLPVYHCIYMSHWIFNGQWLISQVNSGLDYRYFRFLKLYTYNFVMYLAYAYDHTSVAFTCMNS